MSRSSRCSGPAGAHGRRRLALAAIQRAVPDRWAATRAAGIYTLTRIGVLLFLVAFGGSTAIRPHLPVTPGRDRWRLPHLMTR